MKSEGRHIGWLLGGVMMLLLLTACNEESDGPQGSPLHLSSVTRSGDDHPDPSGSIKMFVMTANAQFSTGTFNYSSGWGNTGVSVGEHAQYYLYGFSPSKIGDTDIDCSIATPSSGGDYSVGADLTLRELPMFSIDDVCVIVGVQKVNTEETAESHTEITEGSYGYLSGLNSENYVNLLMAHLYSQLILQFKVDEEYNALRHIKLKTITLKSSYAQTVDATIRLRNGSSLNVNSVIFSPNTSGDKELGILVAKDDKSNERFLGTTVVESASFGPFYCPYLTFDGDGSKLDLICSYDVYNTDDTKVLRSQEVTNKLKVTNMSPGVRKTVTLTIEPTYLYVLSDDDLDNPTIRIEN